MTTDTLIPLKNVGTTGLDAARMLNQIEKERGTMGTLFNAGGTRANYKKEDDSPYTFTVQRKKQMPCSAVQDDYKKYKKATDYFKLSEQGDAACNTASIIPKPEALLLTTDQVFKAIDKAFGHNKTLDKEQLAKAIATTNKAIQVEHEPEYYGRQVSVSIKDIHISDTPTKPEITRVDLIDEKDLEALFPSEPAHECSALTYRNITTNWYIGTEPWNSMPGIRHR